MPVESFTLTPTPPFRLDLTVWVLRRRPDYIVERWDGHTYRRAFSVGEQILDVAVSQTGPPDHPALAVAISTSQDQVTDNLQDNVAGMLADLLGLNVDLTEFYASAEHDEILAPLVARYKGAKPTRYPSLFEALTNGIVCQQLSLTFGLRVLSRLATGYGQMITAGDEPAYAFPTPKRLRDAEPDALREIGFSRQKARALIELSQGICEGQINLGRIECLSDTDAIATLTQLRGVGRWTAEYALLRGLGRTHIFPGDDAGARNALERWLGVSERLSYEDVHAALETWHPYAGLIYFHMLLSGLDGRGELGQIV